MDDVCYSSGGMSLEGPVGRDAGTSVAHATRDCNTGSLDEFGLASADVRSTLDVDGNSDEPVIAPVVATIEAPTDDTCCSPAYASGQVPVGCESGASMVLVKRERDAGSRDACGLVDAYDSPNLEVEAPSDGPVIVLGEAPVEACTVRVGDEPVESPVCCDSGAFMASVMEDCIVCSRDKGGADPADVCVVISDD